MPLLHSEERRVSQRTKSFRVCRFFQSCCCCNPSGDTCTHCRPVSSRRSLQIEITFPDNRGMVQYRVMEHHGFWSHNCDFSIHIFTIFYKGVYSPNSSGAAWGSQFFQETGFVPSFHHHFWFWLGFRGLSPYSFGILFHHHFLVPARVPGLSPYSFGILFHHHFLVPARVPGLLSLLFWHPVPSSFPGSG